MLRRIGLVLTMTLVTAACSSTPDDGYEVADRVLDRLGQPSGEQAAPAEAGECETIEVIDEYGFKSQVSNCNNGAPPTTVEATDLADSPDVDPAQLLSADGDLPGWALGNLAADADESLRPAINEMVSTIQELDQTCGDDFFAWRSALSKLATQADALTALVNGGQGEGYVGTTEARSLSRALMERSLLETGCQNPGGGDRFSTDQLTADGTLELTSRAALGLSELGRVLDDASSGYLFHFFSTADNYEWLRTQTDNVDLIVYGTSQAGAGIDVPVLAEQMSQNAGNAFLYGSLAEVQQHWFPEVERYLDASTVVWLVGAIDLLIDCEPVGREQQFIDRVERRERTFAASGWFGDVDHVNVLLGPVGPPNTNKGNGIKKTEPDPVALEAHTLDYKDRFAEADFCESRADTIASAAKRMVDQGQRVVVVGMPLSPIAYKELPGGAALASNAFGRLSQKLDGVGVDVIDLSTSLQDRTNIWADYTHLTVSGATEFTENLAAELNELGL